MFNFTNPLSLNAKFTKHVAEPNNTPYTFTSVVTVPGFTGIKIFLQPSKYVYGKGGIRQMALLGTTSNPLFCAAYGSSFLLVGQAWVKLSHAQQLASIANELMRTAEDVDQYMSGITNVTEEQTVTRAHMSSISEKAGVNSLVNDVAERRVALSAMFGARVAAKTIDTECKLVKKDSKIPAKMAAKDAKAAQVGFKATKDTKKAFKATKKANAAILKASKQAVADAQAATAAVAQTGDILDAMADNIVEIIHAPEDPTPAET